MRKKEYPYIDLLFDLIRQYKFHFKYIQKWHIRIFNHGQAIVDYFPKNCRIFIFKTEKWETLDNQDQTKWQIKFMLLIENQLNIKENENE